MSAQAREIQHTAGRVHMQKGSYLEAVDIFLKALSDFGPHVGLISDIVAVYYLTGRIEDWKVMSGRLEIELSRSEGLLCKISKTKTQIFLGKMFEEQAEVHKALEMYQAAELSADDNVSYRLKAQAQRLRLMSFLGLRLGLPELYRMVSAARAQSSHFEIEFEHSLMLAEVNLFGMESAAGRLISLVEQNELDSADLRLLYVDYVEEALQKEVSLGYLKNLRVRISLEDGDEFEKAIMLMAQNAEFGLSSQDLNKLSTRLPLMGILRLIILQIKRMEPSNLEAELRRRFLFLLESLQSESKNMLLKKWQTSIANAQKRIYFSPHENILCIQEGPQLSIRKGSFAARCMQAFLNQSKIDIETFIQLTFEAEYNESYYDRARVALSRFNNELSAITGLPKSFLITRSAVDLAPGLTIHKL